MQARTKAPAFSINMHRHMTSLQRAVSSIWWLPSQGFPPPSSRLSAWQVTMDSPW